MREKINKNQEIQSIKMIEKENKILGPLKEGDCVRIPIPSVDRERLDPGNLIGGVTGVDHGQYTMKHLPNCPNFVILFYQRITKCVVMKLALKLAELMTDRETAIKVRKIVSAPENYPE
ncbi:hypothetical protein A3Q56_05959 [Intoshia linei]|uniref:Uncharacterized protein n=1 Tax=Intoshia linei TaxID=1819745 RepID=A0A177AY30_9BILA|nr:hypothetical protein A3Q56_05959 [Intoshia linei]